MSGQFDNVIAFSTDHLSERGRLAAICEVYGRTLLKHDIEPACARRRLALKACRNQTTK